MNREITRRLERLEQREGCDNGLAEFYAAISGLSRGLPSEPVHITPERQARIDRALSRLDEEVVAKIFSEIHEQHFRLLARE